MEEQDQNANSNQNQNQGTTSTIPQPEGKDPVGAERPSQAEGERDTVEEDSAQ